MYSLVSFNILVKLAHRASDKMLFALLSLFIWSSYIFCLKNEKKKTRHESWLFEKLTEVCSIDVCTSHSLCFS